MVSSYVILEDIGAEMLSLTRRLCHKVMFIAPKHRVFIHRASAIPASNEYSFTEMFLYYLRDPRTGGTMTFCF